MVVEENPAWQTDAEEEADSLFTGSLFDNQFADEPVDAAEESTEEEIAANELPVPANDSQQFMDERRLRLDMPDENAIKPSFYWTWRLLSDGYSPAHLQQVRGIELGTVFDHAILAALNQLPTELTWLLSNSDIKAIQKLIDEMGTDEFSELLNELPPNLSAQQVQFYLKTISIDEVESA